MYDILILFAKPCIVDSFNFCRLKVYISINISSFELSNLEDMKSM